MEYSMNLIRFWYEYKKGLNTSGEYGYSNKLAPIR